MTREKTPSEARRKKKRNRRAKRGEKSDERNERDERKNAERSEAKKRKKAPGFAGSQGPEEIRIGDALLSRAPGRSIITACSLNGRVRDGNGCLPAAKATNPKGKAMQH